MSAAAGQVFCSMSDDSDDDEPRPPNPPKPAGRPLYESSDVCQRERVYHRCEQTQVEKYVVLAMPDLLFPTSKSLEAIGSKKVEFYEVLNRTDFIGFDLSVEVQRRYSEFHTLRKVLTKKGVQLPPLPLHRWIPTNRSRWEELNDFGLQLGEVALESVVFNQDIIKELKRFFQDKSPYWETEEPEN